MTKIFRPTYQASALSLLLVVLSFATLAAECTYHQPGVKNLYWGDLHTHSAYSLDAWGFGTLKTPREAYRFAKGAKVVLPGGSDAQLDRPLDFAAVTDHAEWFDLLYICSDPQWSEDPYCSTLVEKNKPESGLEVFVRYVLPAVTGPKAQALPLCTGENKKRCDTASLGQWKRVQEQANAENAPCEFTAFVGYEWSASPSASHSHRNLIFASEEVTREAIDYVRYPSLEALFDQLDSQCLPEDGCEVLSIPHNTNMGDGLGFDVETESERTRQQRLKYERLIEVFQEKGNSECLPAYGQTDEDDCHYEIRLSSHSRAKVQSDFDEASWEKMRSTYVRGLLLRGLAAYQLTEEKKNPLQLGIIGSTDNHTATPGMVNEDEWTGPVFGIGDFDRAMSRMDWNPGGLVAVWAEENTRESLFASMKRKEVYATSGPRIGLNFAAVTDGKPMGCDGASSSGLISMGGEFSKTTRAPGFRVSALYDKVPLQSIEIIKGELRGGKLIETTIEIWNSQAGELNLCQVWQDPDFDPSAPAFWYPRVSEAPTPRWSATQCKLLGRCEDYPDAVQTIREQAWGSPIWYLP
jgi:hypothetical protein